MARSQQKRDRIAFYACTSLALGIIVVMWVWSIRSVVGDGVRGTRQVLSEVSSVAGQTRRQVSPDPATIDAIKAKLDGIAEKGKEEQAAPVAAADASTIDAVAQLMKNDVETYGQEPKN